MEEMNDVELPETLPVMVLGGATLFPHCYMPLCIFEPRYREMLSYALERDRMFCIGHALPDIDSDTHPDPVFSVCTAGLVRACVTHENGTSHLMLSGIERVEILGWEQSHPFRIATIIPKPTLVSCEKEAATRALELVDLAGKMAGDGQPMSDHLQDHLRTVKDPSMIADIMAHTFITDPSHRQELLEVDEICERLELLVDHLAARISGGNT